MLLKTKVNIEQEVEIEIETPAFFKNSFSYLGVIEECVINIFQIEGKRTFLSNDSIEGAKRDIVKAYKEWEHISEEEFFEALGKALKDFDFKPSLRVSNVLDVDVELERNKIVGNY
jgi:hypothetical protein